MTKISLSNYFICLVLFLFSLPMGVLGQSNILKGVVRDVHGIPLTGVNVVEKGTTNGTITDIDGNFSIDAKKTPQ